VDPLSRLIPKLNARLMPTLLMMYVLAFLDRSNVGFAKAALQADAGIGYTAYAFGASIFFVGYAVLEVPSNLILHRVGARRWLARIMITWGVVSAAQAFVQGPMSFYAVRFLLGVAEAGFFPGVILYLTYWYPTSARGRSVGMFYYGAPIALTLGSPLSGLLVAHEWLGLHGWQVMFIIEGLMASLGGVAVLFLLRDRPIDAEWLDDGEKQVLIDAFAEDERKAPRQTAGVWRTLRNPRVLYLSVVYFMAEIGFYGLTFFLPAQVSKALGKSIGLEVGIVSALPWAAAILAVTIVPRFCDRRGNHRAVGALMLLAGGAGLALSGLTASPLIVIASLCVAAAGLNLTCALFWSLPTALLGGAAAAAGIGLINAIGNLGGFVAPNLRAWLEGLFASPSAGLLGLALACLVGSCLFALAPRARSAAG
jgi:MFS family permease